MTQVMGGETATIKVTLQIPRSATPSAAGQVGT